VHGCFLDETAQIIDHFENVRTKLLLIHSPQVISTLSDQFRGIHADQVLVVQSCAPGQDVASKDWLLAFLFAQCSWVPTNIWIRQALLEQLPPERVASSNWSTVPDMQRPPQLPAVEALTIGWLVQETGDGLPETTNFPEHRHFVFGIGTKNLPGVNFPVVDSALKPTRRIEDRCDVIAYFPLHPQLAELPDATIVQAIAEGKAVVTRAEFRPHYGKGPV
jgi:hypothetical protein